MCGCPVARLLRSSELLHADSISFTYSKASDPIFSNVDVTPAAGAMTALTGPSGTGKSTLLFVLGLLLTPTAGRVVVAGDDTSKMTDAARSRIRSSRIGFVFQDAALDPTKSVLANVVESCDYNGRSRPEALTRAEALLEEMGVAVPGTRRPLQISGGQAQRVAICRALLPEPQIILADEPTGNLDELSSAAVLNRLRHEADQGGTVVIATHDPQVLRRCDGRVTL